MLTQFRVQIVTWDKYQIDAIGNKLKGKDWLKLVAAGTTDTMHEEKLATRGLFFDMLRHSKGGRRPGYLVAGSNEPLTLSRLARYLWVSVEELLPPLKRLMITDRIKLLVSPETDEPEEKMQVESEPPSEKILQHRAIKIFWLCWDELHIKSYNREYDKGQWDELNLLKVLTVEKLERFIAYAFHFHQSDEQIGIPKPEEEKTSKLKAPSIENFLKRVPDYSSRLRGQKWEMSQKFATENLKKHQHLLSHQN